MGTVGKAISLLGLFDERSAELGLTEIAKASGFDKATARRLLLSMADYGLVEQNPESKRYRLGAGLLRLARIREATFPLVETTRPIAEKLAEATGETVHASEIGGGVLATILIAESTRATRVILEMGLRLPLHSTASGFAYLAASPPETVRKALAGPLDSFTPFTLTDAQAVAGEVAAARARGFSVCDQGYEEGVISVAAPLLDGAGKAFGALAVAWPSSRTSAEIVQRNGAAVREAAAAITKAMGGRSPRASADRSAAE